MTHYDEKWNVFYTLTWNNKKDISREMCMNIITSLVYYLFRGFYNNLLGNKSC